MSIRFAILGLLAEQPMHGYRLKETFDRRVSPLWGLTTGQIYQTLSALERAGSVEGRGERCGRRPARRVYRITDVGKRELATWLRETAATQVRPFRDDILIRLMMLDHERAPALWRDLERQEIETLSLLMRVTRLCDEQACGDSMDLSRVFLDGMAQRLEADIKNLQRFRCAIERWCRAHQVGVAGDVSAFGASSGLRDGASVMPSRMRRERVAV